ncbi:MAG: chemotaxis protein CheW [Bacillota bacterium]|jgi:two-component system chemotaxis sensor kinase CheA
MLQFPGMTEEDIKVFLAEADEQLQYLEDGLLDLEQNSDDPEVIAQIFRAAHTLKGSSATLGHDKMARLTHSMESALDLVRKSQANVTPALMDLLLECLDMLRILNREIATAQDSGADVTELDERLLDVIESVERQASAGGVAGGGGVPPMGGAPDEAMWAGQFTGPADVRVWVRFVRTCPMPSVRAYQVIDRLSALGTLAYSEPSVDQIEAGDDVFDLVAVVEYDGDALEPLIEMVRNVTDVEDVRVLQVSQIGSARAAMQATAAREAAAPAELAAPLGVAAGGATVSAARGAARTAAGPPVTAASTTTVRVDVARLDVLSNLVAELVIDRTHLAQLESKLAEKHGGDELVSELNRTSTHIGRLTTELQEAINKARMLPIDNVFKRFPRMVRDLAQKQGKEVELIIRGEDTELDRSVSEEIGDPLIHLLRNAVGHGIEAPEERIRAGKPARGVVRLSAFRQENYIVVQVADDGRGIDPDLIRASAIRKGIVTEDAAARMSDKDAISLVFSSGLSTAAQADQVSGRGVGMDIVRRNLEKLNGSISVDTAIGRGATFTVKLPLTLAIIRALLVSLGQRIYAIPLNSVEEITRVETSDINTVGGREAIRPRGEVVPLLWLGDVFGVRGHDRSARLSEPGQKVFAVIASSHEGKVGLAVDRLVGEMEIVIKSLGTFVGNIPGVSGVTILGDGRVALIVDVPSLVRSVVDERNAVSQC